MTSIVGGVRGGRPDPCGVSANIAKASQDALVMSSLKPETLESLAAIASTATRISGAPLQFSDALEAVARLHKVTVPMPQSVLSESTCRKLERLAGEIARFNDGPSANIRAILSNLTETMVPLEPNLQNIRRAMMALHERIGAHEAFGSVDTVVSNRGAACGPLTAASTTRIAAERDDSNDTYDRAAHQLADNLGISHSWPLPSQPLKIDATASSAFYDAISETAPEVAVEIDQAADQVDVAFVSKRQVRYSLAVVFCCLIIAAYIVSDPDLKILPHPWNSMLEKLIEGGAFVIPTAYAIVQKGNGRADVG